MNKRPKLRVSRLRDIGWSIWDPIGLNDFGADWKGVSFADEYDNYLTQVASMLKNNAPEEDAVDYLIQIETEHMGLSPRPGMYERTKAVVSAIQNDDQLWNYS